MSCPHHSLEPSAIDAGSSAARSMPRSAMAQVLVVRHHMARALLLFTSLLLLAGCAHLSDAGIRKNLPGAWHVVQPQLDRAGWKMIYTIAPNGDFTRETLMSHEGVHGFEMSR